MVTITKEELAQLIADAIKQQNQEVEIPNRELDAGDLQTLINHARNCKDGVCEIRNTYKGEIHRAMKEDYDLCPSCKKLLSKKEKPEECPNCKEELDWED